MDDGGIPIVLACCAWVCLAAFSRTHADPALLWLACAVTVNVLLFVAAAEAGDSAAQRAEARDASLLAV